MSKATARLCEVDGDKALEFTYNPKELTLTKAAQWHRQPNKGAASAGKPEFGGSQPMSLQMEVLFDDWEQAGDLPLTAKVQRLMDWMTPSKRSVRDKLPQPALLQLQWGSNDHIAQLHGFIKSCTAKYTMFKPDGTPVRATAQLTMEEAPREPQPTNPSSGALAGRRTHVMAAGDSLHSIAYREYHDAGLWRGLAAFNGIDDPLRVPPGRRLLIPTADEAAALR